MNRVPRVSVCGCLVLLLGVSPSRGRAESVTERPCPFAAHNCYSDVGVRQAEQRLAEALQAGLRYIEVDVNHQPAAGGFIVTHKSDNPPTQPLLQDYLPPLWKKWSSEPFEHILIIEFKAGRAPAIAEDFHAYLLKYRDLLCTFAPDGSPRAKGPISVYLTGSTRLGQAYINYATNKGELLARRDEGFSGPHDRDRLRAYLQQPPRPGVAYLTMEWGVVVGKGRSYTAPLPPENQAWLEEIVAGARKQHYRFRFYTLNVRHTYHPNEPLTPGEWDGAWTACVRAGVDMIATDQYTLAAEWWKRIGRKLK
jgi:hypothetical protein